MSKKDLMQLPNIGKKIANRLINMEITTPEKIKELGPEEIFLRNFQKYGWEHGMCSCYLYALEGAITGERWNKIPENRKKELCAFVKKVRNSI